MAFSVFLYMDISFSSSIFSLRSGCMEELLTVNEMPLKKKRSSSAAEECSFPSEATCNTTTYSHIHTWKNTYIFTHTYMEWLKDIYILNPCFVCCMLLKREKMDLCVTTLMSSHIVVCFNCFFWGFFRNKGKVPLHNFATSCCHDKTERSQPLSCHLETEANASFVFSNITLLYLTCCFLPLTHA